MNALNVLEEAAELARDARERIEEALRSARPPLDDDLRAQAERARDCLFDAEESALWVALQLNADEAAQ